MFVENRIQLEHYLALVEEFDALWSNSRSDCDQNRMDELLILIRAFETTQSDSGMYKQADSVSMYKTSHKARFCFYLSFKHQC